jgi:hypothetical protein
MKHFRGIALCVGLAGAVTLSACSDDTGPPPNGPHPHQFEDLSEKWHVLNNFELAHNKRMIYRYDELIDDNYTFFFDTTKNGSPTTIQWGRPDDVTITTGLFSVVDKLELDLVDLEKPVWTEMTVSDSETWYTTTLYYSFVVKIGATTYTSVSPAQMSFTVRNAGTVDKPRWKLVELRDLAHLRRSSTGRGAERSAPRRRDDVRQNEKRDVTGVS